MFKAGTLLLSACLFSAPTFAQDNPKDGPDSEAVIKELQENLVKARDEANRERERAEAALEAAEKERDRAIQAEKEARQQQELAEQSQLEALRQAEQARAAAEAEAIARKAAEAGEKAKVSEPDAKERKVKRGERRKANIAALEKQVEMLTQQMQEVQAELKALRDHITGEPRNKFSGRNEALPPKKSVESFNAPLKAKPFKKAPTPESKSPMEAGLPPGKTSARE